VISVKRLLVDPLPPRFTIVFAQEVVQSSVFFPRPDFYFGPKFEVF